MSLLKTALHRIKLNRPLVFKSPLQVHFRTCASTPQVYKESEAGPDLRNYTDYEVVHNPEEWKYVERLLPSKWIPDPKPKVAYHSGWKPQTAVPEKLPYFVERTKNHMVPVYLQILDRGIGRRTLIRRVEGDLYKLADELVDYLKTQPRNDYRVIGVKVEEIKRRISLRGDFVEYTKQFLLDKGF